MCILWASNHSTRDKKSVEFKNNDIQPLAKFSDHRKQCPRYVNMRGYFSRNLLNFSNESILL